ncbi:MAG: hypothetical protein KDD70_08335 [Bdellovibrionales bacterium]|nr:hypothetical protein [Bdellovibrionales bacterium]
MTILTKDTEYSHAILSYLLAARQGEFAYLNILGRLGAEVPGKEVVGEIQKQIDLLNGCLKETLEDKPVFKLTWEEPESDVAKKIYEIADQVTVNLEELTHDLSAILSRQQFNEITGTRLILLLAALGRHTYARDNYLRCFYNFYKDLGNSEDATRYRTGVKSSEKDVEYTNGLIAAYQQYPELPLEFYHTLFGEVIALPGLIRKQIFDLRLLCSVYKGPFTYEMAQIPEDRANQWAQLGVSAEEAGNWEAWGIHPQEALLWMQAGVSEISIAGLWKAWRFPVVEAAKWIQGEFAPNEAADWANENFDPDEARQLINRGVSHPSLIKS